MFEVEKPRRFHYEPRFYDPEKEKWEALKKKYAMQQESEARARQAESEEVAVDDDDPLAYYQKRVRDINREQRAQAAKLSWRDLFRKREMPKFNYQSRFDGTAGTAMNESPTGSETSEAEAQTLADKYRQSKHRIKIRRRFDISDTEYFKPISGTKIILYCFIVFLLISLIIAF